MNGLEFAVVMAFAIAAVAFVGWCAFDAGVDVGWDLRDELRQEPHDWRGEVYDWDTET